MGKPVIVQGDSVKGKDKHKVTGPAVPPPPGSTFSGTGDYQYVGGMTGNLSTFVKINGKPIALVTSQSSLNAGQTALGGGHNAASGTNFFPQSPVPVPASLNFVPPIVGTGVPNAAAGSSLLTIGGTKVLLDGDKIDTCDGTGAANSTVTATGQSFVSCSG
jgi:uncharacterized Zn-binding protein involved in type VI secretion